MFCEQCQEFFRQIEDGQSIGEFHAKDLADTANSGCYICISLLDFISQFEAKDLSELKLKWEFSVHWDDKERYSVRFDSEELHQWESCGFSFRAPPNQLGTEPIASDSEPVECYRAPVNSSDPSLAKLVQSWLRACVDEQSGLFSYQDTSYRPPRLLCIESGSLRLIKGSECPESSEWATLSHCWGPNPTFLRLTSTNLSQLELDIPLDSLPPTFRDAVRFCESISINFIWIDSLCIIQKGEGSKEDWFHHMTEMRQVYQNATLNLAADWASSAQDGLFRDRNVAHIRRPVVQSQGGPLQGCWQLGYDKELERLFSNSPLGSRAWVVQERFLSPRMVSFSADQVYWRCNHGPCYKSERFPEGLDPDVAYPILCTFPFIKEKQQTMLDWYTSDIPPSQSFLSVRFLYEAGHYCSRALTYPNSDKFAAFAGIAEQYSWFFKEDYVAGFFRSHLPWGLAWRVQSPIPLRIARSAATLPYRAPSWSWATIDHEVKGPVAHPYYKDVPGEPIELSEITETCVELLDPGNKFGPLLHASLKLRASLLECTWDIPTGNAGDVNLKLSVGENVVAWFDSVEDLHSEQAHTRCMPLRATADLDESRDYTIYFLVLRRVLGSTSPTYIRIGTGEVDIPESSVLDVTKSFSISELELV